MNEQAGERSPKLRFPEFSSEWIMTTLERACYMQAGKFISAKEISENFQDNFYPCYGGNGLRGYVKSYNYEGKYPLIGRQGALCGNVLLASGSFYATEHAIVVTPKDDNNADWLFYELLRLNLNQYATGQAQPGLSVEVLKKIVSIMPEDCLEQKKIADFLISIDEKLAILKKEHGLMQDYKKGMMQKIFSQKIRFKDEQGNEYPEWVEKKLGEVGDFKSGIGFNENEQGGKEGVPFFKVSDMNLEKNSSTMIDANHYVSLEQITRLGYKPISKYSIIFAKVGAAIFLERKRIAKDFLFDNNMMAIIPNEKIELYFLKQYFEIIKLSRYAQVGALPSYNSSDLAIIKISLPSLLEQKKIADFLTSLDEKIENLNKEIQQMTLFKKGLLQKMFVQNYPLLDKF